MQAGKLRHRVTIQQDQGTAQSADGGHIADWVTLATVWAEVAPLTGRELWAASQVQSEVTHRVRIRYGSSLSDLTGDVRLVFGSRLLHLQSALNVDERRREWELMCREAPDATATLVPPSFYGVD